MRFLRFAVLTFKRYFKQPLFVLMLVMIIAASFYMADMSDISEMRLNFGLVSSIDLDDVGPVHFIKFDDERLMRDAVENYEIDSGFVMSDAFLNKLFKTKDEKMITVKREDSKLSTLGEEIIFSALIDRYGDRLLKNAIDEADIFKGYGFSIDEIEKIAEDYIEKGSTYHFDYRWVDNGAAVKKVYSFPFEYIAKNLILVVIFMAMRLFLSDIKSGVYSRFAVLDKAIYAVIFIAVPIAIYIALYSFLTEVVL